MASNQDLGRMVISVDMDSTEFTRGLAEINRSMKTAKSDAMAQVAHYQAMGDEMGVLRARLNGLNDQYELSAKKQDALKRKYDQAVQMYGAASAQAQKYARQINDVSRDMAGMERKIELTTTAIQEMNEGLQRSETRLGRFEESLERAGKKADQLKDRLGGIAAGAGLAVGAIGGIGVAMGKMASETEKSLTRVENAFDLTKQQADELKDKVKSVWKDGFGEDMNEVSESIVQVKQNMKGLNDVELEDATKKVITLSQTFGADSNEVSRGINGLMTNFGLSFQEAADLVAMGGKKGLNSSNEMFDNLAEYTPLFKSMGYTAEEMFNILIGGLEAGAYNLDYVNDSYKEFGLRIKDGSKTTSDAMSQMSAGTQKLWKDMLAGKASASDVSTAVIKELVAMDDQVAAGQIGVGLFGTKWEDLESSVMYATQNGADYLGDFEGASDKMVKNVEEDFDTRFKKTMREAQDAIMPLAETMLEIAEDVMPVVSKGIKEVSDGIESLVGWYKELTPGGQGVVKTLTGMSLAIPVLLTGITSLAIVFGSVAGSISKIIGLVRTLKGQNVGGLANDLERLGNAGNGGANGSGSGRGRRGRRNNLNNNNNNNSSRSGDNDGGDERETRSSRRNSGGGKAAKVLKTGGKALGVVGAVGALGVGLYQAKTADNKGDKGAAVGESVGSLAGGAAGTALGSAIGTAILPGVGTALGGIVGGAAGAFTGGWVGEKLGRWGFETFGKESIAIKEEYNKMVKDKVFDKGIEVDFKVKGISEETQKSLNAYNTLYTKANEKFKLVSMEQRVINKGTMDTLINDQKKLTNSTIGEINKKEKREIASINKNTVLSKEQKTKAIAAVKESYAKQRETTQSREKQINDIIKKANSEKRALTKSEINKIESLRQKDHKKYLSSTGKTEKEVSAIKKRETEMRKLNNIKEINDVLKKAKKTHTAEVEASTKTYKKKISDAKKARDMKGGISQEEYEKVVANAKKERKDSIKEADQKYNKVQSSANKQKNEVKKAAEEQKKQAVRAAEQEKAESERISNAKATGVEKIWKSIANFPVNAINKVMKLFGMKKQFDLPYPGVGGSTTYKKAGKTNSSGQTQMAAYAKGTYMGKHKGGMALVGEEGYELAYTPKTGMGVVGLGGPETVDLPKGSAVLPHNKSKQLLKQNGASNVLQKYNFPAFAKGTGDDGFFESALTFTKSMWGGLKSVKDSVFDLAAGGTEAIWEKVKGTFDFSQSDTLIPTDNIMSMLKDIAKSPIQSIIDAATSFKEEEESATGTGSFGNWKPYTGDFNKISNKMGVYDYLYDLGKQVVAKFKDKYKGLYMSSGKRSGSANTGGVPSDHVSGLGLDLARGGVRDNSYFEMAKSLANHPYLKFVIGSNMWNTSKGGSKFVNYPYAKSSPHDNHLHISAKSPSAAKKTGANSEAFGVGDYSASGKGAHGVSASGLKFIQSKEGFSPKWYDLGDGMLTIGWGTALSKSQAASKGYKAGGTLPKETLQAMFEGEVGKFASQVKSKLNAKGFKVNQNQFDMLVSYAYNRGMGGFNQLLKNSGSVGAMGNNLVKYWGSNTKFYSGLIKRRKEESSIFKNGYEDGGLITREQLAWVGEGNKPEAIIPLQPAKRSRALRLLQQTAKVLGAEVVSKKGNNNQSVEVSSSGQSTNNDVIAQLVAQNNMLMETLINVVQNKELKIGDKAIFEANKRQLEKENRRTNYQLGY